MKRIAIQGEIGSFHHAAAISWYVNDSNIVACKTFRDVFKALKNAQADAAIVAIENSVHGSINEVYDLLLEYRFPIVGEIALHVQQCLISIPGTLLSDITFVHSHPVALSQCSMYLDTTLPTAERIENYDTSASVSLIKKLGDKRHGAIASSLAAEINGMTILQRNIQNANTNYTRFLAIQPTVQETMSTTKSSLVIETQHTPGALYEVLGICKKYNVNIAKLQSRPCKNAVWRYMFFVDIECNSATTRAIISDIHERGASATLLGSYTAALEPVDS